MAALTTMRWAPNISYLVIILLGQASSSLYAGGGAQIEGKRVIAHKSHVLGFAMLRRRGRAIYAASA